MTSGYAFERTLKGLSYNTKFNRQPVTQEAVLANILSRIRIKKGDDGKPIITALPRIFSPDQTGEYLFQPGGI